jgi:hypothetical protein
MTFKGVVLSKFCTPLSVGLSDGEAIEVFTRNSYERQESRSKEKLEAIVNQSSFASVHNAIELVESLKKRLKTDKEEEEPCKESQESNLVIDDSIFVRIRSFNRELETIRISRFSSIDDLKAEYCKRKKIEEIDFVFDGISLREGILDDALENEDLIDAK